MTMQRRDFVRLAATAALVPGLTPNVLWEGLPTARLLPDTGGLLRWPRFDAAIVIDCLSSPGEFNVQEGDGSLSPAALQAARGSGVTAVNLTLGVVGEMPDPFESTIKDLAGWEAAIDENPETFRRIRRVRDIGAAKSAGQVGVIYGFQDTVMLDADLERMDMFHALGVRIVQLTYNGRNRVGDGSLEPGNAGLSRFGIELVERLNELGVLVDLSHCGRRTTAEGIAASAAPPAVTHSGCDAVFSHPRSKRDTELRALADKGGVIGIYFMPYLNASGPPTAEDVMLHLDHALNVCGEDHVGIGSDNSTMPIDDTPEYYAAVEREVTRRQALGISAAREENAPFVPELNSVRRLETVADMMSARGHSDRVIEKVLGANWLRLFGEVWS